MVNALTKLGYLHPPPIATTSAADIQTSDPDLHDRVAGQLERVNHVDPEHLVVTGWAIARNRDLPADAVFLTYSDADGNPIIFALAKYETVRPDVNNQFGGRFGTCGWTVELPLANLPTNLQTTSIAAWTLDTDTGKAVKLPGETRVQLFQRAR